MKERKNFWDRNAGRYDRFMRKDRAAYEKMYELIRPVVKAKMWGDRIFEKCGIRRDEEGDGGKTLEIRGKRRLSARDGGANYQQS